jgi:L-lactate dehydrogenase (cytochrome)
VFEYVRGGVEDDVSRRGNRAAFEEWGFVPRVLVNVSKRTTATTLYGHEYAAPFGIAPMGVSALSAYRGDIVLAQGASACNVPMIMSGTSVIRMEEVCATCPTTWFQAYLPGDRTRYLALIDRIAAAGFKTLVVTVDVAILSNRENNIRAGFAIPMRPTLRLFWDGLVRPRWTFGTLLPTLMRHGIPHLENSFAQRGAPILSRSVVRDLGSRDNLDWSDWDVVRSRWKGRLIIKGVMRADDARTAIDRGAEGVIVSNHGGRQLDHTVAPLRVLPSIKAVAGNVPVMLDSGIRRGTDVLKALALGADFVFVGRPFNYAASIGGEAGVKRGYEILQGEVLRGMGQLGLNRLSEITTDYLFPPSGAASQR